jgi:hypothetical protein
MRKKEKLHKKFCEIEGCPMTDPAALEHHHIIERTEIGTSNDNFNLAVICANHHSLLHAGRLKIIGVYPSTKPFGRTLIYELDGKMNISGIDKTYFNHRPSQMKITKEENGK